ncbi:hypothetical protein GOP47_0028399 [Adiantum capillus-veneris]|nr:hypothetical protein GOP47_0028399 [Adiantum capillus-veneris]
MCRHLQVQLESIVESARNGRDTDIIIACDHNGLNAGSFLVRKSEWTRGFLKRWWLKGNDKDVPMIDKLFEQAVLTDLVKTDKSVAAHVHISPIRDFNAYGYPAGEGYLFQPGDFVVHCPGPTLKKWLPAYTRQWERMMKECGLRELWMDAGMQFEAAGIGNL